MFRLKRSIIHLMYICRSHVSTYVCLLSNLLILWISESGIAGDEGALPPLSGGEWCAFCTRCNISLLFLNVSILTRCTSNELSQLLSSITAHRCHSEFEWSTAIRLWQRQSWNFKGIQAIYKPWSMHHLSDWDAVVIWSKQRHDLISDRCTPETSNHCNHASRRDSCLRAGCLQQEVTALTSLRSSTFPCPTTVQE